MKRRIFGKFLLILLIVSLIIPVNAAPDTVIERKCANTLVKLGLMKGYEDGSLRLENNIRRSEFITLILNVACLDEINDIDNIVMGFLDLSKDHWAYDYIKTAWHYGIVAGYPDNTFAPDNIVTLPEALLAVIRILGYESEMVGSWPENVLHKAEELELTKHIDAQGNKALTRSDVAIIIFNSLTVELR